MVEILVVLGAGETRRDRSGVTNRLELKSAIDDVSDDDAIVGSDVSLLSRENIPLFGSHWKYL